MLAASIRNFSRPAHCPEAVCAFQGSVCYISHDHGRTLHRGSVFYPPATSSPSEYVQLDEPQLGRLWNSSLLLIGHGDATSPGRDTLAMATSTDNGMTFGGLHKIPGLVQPGCGLGMLVRDDVIYISYDDNGTLSSAAPDAHDESRNNLTVAHSSDYGTTWSKHSVDRRFTGLSAMTVVRAEGAQQLGLLYEGGPKRFDGDGIYLALLPFPPTAEPDIAVLSTMRVKSDDCWHAASVPSVAQPTALQLEWQDLEVGAQITWSVASMGVACNSSASSGQRNQNYGCVPKREVVAAFDGKQLNVSDWLAVAQSANAKYSFMMASQWSGFATWNTSTHNFSTAHTTAKRDVFGEYVAASRRLGMRSGCFYSAHHNFYLVRFSIDFLLFCDCFATDLDMFWTQGVAIGKPDQARLYGGPNLTQIQYDRMVATHIHELYENYGQDAIFDWWWDAPLTSYNPRDNYPDESLVKQAQCKYAARGLCLGCYNNAFPRNNLRWVGNEGGAATIPNWHAMRLPGYSGDPKIGADNWGDPKGEVYAPASCDDVFTQGAHDWMWEPGYDNHLKSVFELVTAYKMSVGRGCTYLFNLAPDNTGAISGKQKQRYADFGAAVRCLFGLADWVNSTSLPLSPSVQWDLPTAILSDNVTLVLQEELSRGQLLNESVFEAFVPGGSGGHWWAVLPPDLPPGSGHGARLWSLGHKRMFEGVAGLREATKLRLTALSSFGDTPTVRRITYYDMHSRANCLRDGANAAAFATPGPV